MRAKSGKALTRYFPEVVAALQAIKFERFVLDGELLIARGNTLSFDALQMRLHPAQSRIDRLSRETPAFLMCFDLLQDHDGAILMDQPLTQRRAALEAFFAEIAGAAFLRLSPFSRKWSDAQRWLGKAGHGALDGVVAKPFDEPYLPGERAMLKVKCLRTADCVVGGFRYETGGHLVGSMLLGLYDNDGMLDHIGFTSGISDSERKALTRKLERLRGGKGFTGNAPGAPSRWSSERSAEWIPLKPKLVAEVQYDHVTGFVTARSSCAGGPTKRRDNAPSINSHARRVRLNFSAVFWRDVPATPRATNRGFRRFHEATHERLHYVRDLERPYSP